MNVGFSKEKKGVFTRYPALLYGHKHQKQLGEKGLFYLTAYISSWRDVRAGMRRQELKQAPWRNTIYVLALQAHVHLPLLYALGPSI